MNLIIFTFDENEKIYRCSYLHDSKSGLLALFLLSEIRESGQTWKDWLLDETEKFTIGNIITVEKDENAVYLRDSFSEETDMQPCIKLAKQNLIEIIKQWEEAQKVRPKEIIITKENEKIMLSMH